MKITCNQCQTEMIAIYKVESFGGITIFKKIKGVIFNTIYIILIVALHSLKFKREIN